MTGPEAANEQRVWVEPPNDPYGIAVARRQGFPLDRFQAVLIGDAQWVFWSRVRRDDGTLLDLPPMYRLTPVRADEAVVPSNGNQARPDTPPGQILADWFGDGWSALTESQQVIVVAELRRYFSGEFLRGTRPSSSDVHGRAE